MVLLMNAHVKLMYLYCRVLLLHFSLFSLFWVKFIFGKDNDENSCENLNGRNYCCKLLLFQKQVYF